MIGYDASRLAVGMRAGGVFVVALLLTSGCWATPKRSAYAKIGSRHFRSRGEIVPIVDRLLRQKRWEVLAQYYDLSGSDVLPSQLLTGEYFFDFSPHAAPPEEEFRRYRHPFAPGARFDHEMDGDEANVVVLVMVLDRPLGPDRRERRVYRFRVRRHGWGWQLLPRRIRSEGAEILSRRDNRARWLRPVTVRCGESSPGFRAD